MTNEEKVIVALQKLLGREVPMTGATHLRDDLGLDSANLVELTVLMHTLHGVDLGRKAAEHKIIPRTVADVAALLAKP